ncbi:unnamed protein product [Prunus armeniaca]
MADLALLQPGISGDESGNAFALQQTLRRIFTLPKSWAPAPILYSSLVLPLLCYFLHHRS